MKLITKIKYLLALLAMYSLTDMYAQDIPDSYLIEAAGNNPGLKSRFNEYLAALEKIPQAATLSDPQLTFGYFIQPVETRVGPQQARISISQMFPWFGTLGAKEDVLVEVAKSKYEMFEEEKSRLFYDVRSTYYNLYFTGKAIDITLENLDILNAFRRLALVKVESGLASSVDVLRAEIEIADLENQLALLNDNYQVLQTGFNNLLNVEEQRTINLPDSLYGNDHIFTREAVLDSIRYGNHRVLQTEFLEASYEKQEKVAEKAGKPNIMIGLDYLVVGKGLNPMTGLSESGKDAIVFPMIGISIPLYREKYRSMVREAVLMQESARNEKLDNINILETTFQKALKEYNDAGRRISLYRMQSERATRALNILRIDYETSGKNFEEILRMEGQLLKYRLEFEKGRADKKAATAFIDYLMGK